MATVMGPRRKSRDFSRLMTPAVLPDGLPNPAHISRSTYLDHARSVAKQIRAGMIHINGASTDTVAPFGGYKQSGNGREWGDFGLEEFLEVKAVMGYGAVAAE